MAPINDKDRLILAHLRKNSRILLTTISRKTNIPVSTIFDRLKKSEKHYIIKHTSLLNFAKLGYNTRANITIKVCREDKEPLKNYLIKHPAINSAYKINNGYDFMIEGIFKQIKDIEEFLDTIDKKFKIENKKTYFIIEDLKREAFLSDITFPENI